MDYQARLNEILEKVRKGGVYDVMPEYERQSDYLDTDVAQEAITSLVLESLTIEIPKDKYSKQSPAQYRDSVIDKWQTNQEGE